MPWDLGYNKQQEQHKRTTTKTRNILGRGSSLFFLFSILALLALRIDIRAYVVTTPNPLASVMNINIPSQPKDGKTWKEVNKEHYEQVPGDRSGGEIET